MVTELLSKPVLEPGMVVECIKAFPRRALRLIFIVTNTTKKGNVFGLWVDAQSTDILPKVKGIFVIPTKTIKRIWRFRHEFAVPNTTETDYTTWPDPEDLFEAIEGHQKHCIWRCWHLKTDVAACSTKQTNKKKEVKIAIDPEIAPDDNGALSESGVETVVVSTRKAAVV